MSVVLRFVDLAFNINNQESLMFYFTPLQDLHSTVKCENNQYKVNIHCYKLSIQLPRIFAPFAIHYSYSYIQSLAYLNEQIMLRKSPHWECRRKCSSYSCSSHTLSHVSSPGKEVIARTRQIEL